MSAFLEWLDRNLLALFFVLFGSAVFAARNRERTLYGWICCNLIGSGTGIVTNLLLLDWSSLSENSRLAISFAAAANGPLVLDLLAKIFTDKAAQHLNITPKKD